jgi:hypothetical protein
MKALKAYKFGATAAEQVQDNRETADWIRLKGNPGVPFPPRDVRALAGSRGVLLVWSLPEVHANVVGWRVFKGDENTSIGDIPDKGIRQKFIELSAGAVPPTTNIFVCSVNGQGVESPKVQVLATALAEAGAPPNPAPPPEYNTQVSGGGDRRKYDGSQGFINPRSKQGL